jgi:hypothetical protein
MNQERNRWGVLVGVVSLWILSACSPIDPNPISAKEVPGQPPRGNIPAKPLEVPVPPTLEVNLNDKELSVESMKMLMQTSIYSENESFKQLVDRIVQGNIDLNIVRGQSSYADIDYDGNINIGLNIYIANSDKDLNGNVIEDRLTSRGVAALEAHELAHIVQLQRELTRIKTNNQLSDQQKRAEYDRIKGDMVESGIIELEAYWVIFDVLSQIPGQRDWYFEPEDFSCDLNGSCVYTKLSSQNKTWTSEEWIRYAGGWANSWPEDKVVEVNNKIGEYVPIFR